MPLRPALARPVAAFAIWTGLQLGCGQDGAGAQDDDPADAQDADQAEAEPTVRTSRPPSTPRTSDLPEVPRPTIASRFPTADVAIVARVSRNDRQATIVWPAFREGAPAGDAVLAVAFRRQGMRWLPIGEVVTLRQSDGRREMEALLGGEQTIVERPCGVARDTLVQGIRAGMVALGDAARRGESDATIQAYEALAPHFAFDALAFDALTGEWILSALRGEPLPIELDAGEGDWFDYTLPRGEEIERGRMPLVRCDGGWALGAPL